jgi:hypothetical protein
MTKKDKVQREKSPRGPEPLDERNLRCVSTAVSSCGCGCSSGKASGVICIC